MNVIKTDIPEVLVFQPRVFNDARGYFFESFRKETFDNFVPNTTFVQANESLSDKGVLRGLHYQKGEYAQGKLVRVIKGAVYDIAVDIRVGSPTYGKYVGIELNEENNKQLWVPRGFAHGFLVLQPNTIFSYQCDNYYNKEAEGGIIYNDPELGIKWPGKNDNLLLSEKDIILPLLKETNDFQYKN